VACDLVDAGLLGLVFGQAATVPDASKGERNHSASESRCIWYAVDPDPSVLKQLAVYVYGSADVVPRSSYPEVRDVELAGATEAFEVPQRAPRAVVLNFLYLGHRYVLAFQSSEGETKEEMLEGLLTIARSIVEQ
jgi:hypothetical protein